MKFLKQFLFVIIVVLISSCSSYVTPETIELTQADVDAISSDKTDKIANYLNTGINFIENGDFSDSSKNWDLFLKVVVVIFLIFTNEPI